MTILVSHPTGNPNVRAVLRALNRSGILHSFHSTLALPPWLAKLQVIPRALQLEIARRVFTEVPASKTRSRPFREIIRLASERLRFRALVRHEVGFASIDRVYEDLDRAVARYLEDPRETIRAIYAYEDGALHSFRAARSLGIATIYELPIAYWRTRERIFREEFELRPEWAETLPGLKDSEAKRARKEEEVLLADQIVVPSTFAQKSLTEHFGVGLPICVVPYGAPFPIVSIPSVRTPNQPLHIFYAGHLSQRKGVADLFESVRLAEFPWRLTLAGPKPARTCHALERALDHPHCRWLGVVPHATLLQEMTRAHVFVFPSLVEGLALVVLEALSSGLPVITTPNSGGSECIEQGVEGFIVPIRDPEAVTSRLAALFDDEERRFAMANAALAKSARLSWARHEDQIRQLVSKIFIQ